MLGAARPVLNAFMAVRRPILKAEEDVDHVAELSEAGKVVGVTWASSGGGHWLLQNKDKSATPGAEEFPSRICGGPWFSLAFFWVCVFISVLHGNYSIV